ncbi:hypothetical protein EBZ38_12885 [bacterium]|nr:hypothetical protein [bacterium]
MNCICGQLAGDEGVPFETTAAIIMIINWMRYGIEAFKYDTSRKVIIMPNANNRFGKEEVAYSEYMAVLKGAFEQYRAMASIQDVDCGC